MATLDGLASCHVKRRNTTTFYSFIKRQQVTCCASKWIYKRTVDDKAVFLETTAPRYFGDCDCWNYCKPLNRWWWWSITAQLSCHIFAICKCITQYYLHSCTRFRLCALKTTITSLFNCLTVSCLWQNWTTQLTLAAECDALDVNRQRC